MVGFVSPGQFYFRPERERDALFFEYVEDMTGLDVQRAWRVCELGRGDDRKAVSLL